MSRANEILQLARSRSIEQNFTYAGAMTPVEAFELLQAEPQALLVDVRTKAELALVGRVPGAVNIEWAFYPGMVPNPDFGQQLSEMVNKDRPVVFMCRTGGRSHNAAVIAQQLGFNQAYNMLEGFEGESNELKQRTTINGWRHANLPWTN